MRDKVFLTMWVVSLRDTGVIVACFKFQFEAEDKVKSNPSIFQCNQREVTIQ